MHRSRTRRLAWKMFIAMGVWLLVPAFSWACAVCWGGDDGLSRGLNVSIMFLMSMPFLISGSIFGVIYIAYKRAQGQRWPDIVMKNFPWRQKENQL